MPFTKEVIKATNRLLQHFDSQLTTLKTKQEIVEEFEFIDFLHHSKIKSNSQLYQDMFVLHTSNNKTGGFFVEFGATDGIKLSNTYILEKHFGWKGILAEPAKSWAKLLSANRNCVVDHRCVWTKTGELLQFNEVSAEAELSTIRDFSHLNIQAATADTSYTVETVSLNDLLETHHAPSTIDYLSIDTEGSELEILKALDFRKWNINMITVEHNNFSRNRKMIHKLLTSKGYIRKLRGLSRWDDFYVKQTN